MNVRLKFFTGFALITLAACSTQRVKQDEATNTHAGALDKAPTMANEAGQISGQNPPMTLMKNGKKLNLIRIMDGGICKNELQGLKGAFSFCDTNQHRAPQT